MRRVYLCEGPYGDVWNIVAFDANANVTSVERDCEVGVVEDQTDDYDGVDLTCPAKREAWDVTTVGEYQEHYEATFGCMPPTAIDRRHRLL